MKLTSDFLKTALPPRGTRLEVRDDEEAGLVFRVTDSGRRSWSVRYLNAAGDHRRKAIGPFPSIGLAKAREEARKIKGTVARGSDVVATDRAVKAEAKRQKLRTLGGAGEAYFADAELGLHKPNASGAKRPKTTKEEQRIFDTLVEPEFGDTPLADLRRADIQAFVSKVSKKSASNGRFCRNVLRQILSYAVWKDLVDHNPAQQIAVIPSKPRERVLTDAEVKAIWKACERPASVDKLALSLEMGIALRLALVTLLRGGEVVGARWSEFDMKSKTWTIPAARMKGKRPHMVPLSDMAVDLIEEAKEAIKGEVFVFENKGSDPAAPMAAMSFSRALTRMAQTLKIVDAHAHDFRRTGATNLTSERVGIPRFIVSQVIAHASDTGGAAAVTGRHYDLNDYLPEKRKALEAWAALLAEIVTGVKRADNVKPIKAA